MAVLFLGSALFLLAFIVHVAVWRIRRPQATAQSLIVLFVATIVLAVLAIGLAAWLDVGLRPWLPGTLGEWTQATVMALSIAAAYVLSYPAVEVESPILVMVDAVAQAGPNGIARDDFYGQLGDDVFIDPRINDLLLEGLARETGGRYVLTSKGRHLAAVFSFWRRILGCPIGG